MNIFLFELKAQIKTFIIWTSVLLLTYTVFFEGIYPIFYDSLEDVLKMLSGFPPEFAAAFGVNITDMFSYSGFFSFCFMYISIIGVIMAITLTVSAFAREKRSKCADFLLTKPIIRRDIFKAKLLSNLVLLIISNIIFTAGAVVLYLSENADGALTGKFIIAASGIFFTQLVFLSVGIFYAVFTKKVRSIAGAATAFGFGAFILSALVNILEEEALFFIAPLKYFEPASVFSSGAYPTKYVIAAVIIFTVLTCLAYIKFCKSDAHAV